MDFAYTQSISIVSDCRYHNTARAISEALEKCQDMTSNALILRDGLLRDLCLSDDVGCIFLLAEDEYEPIQRQFLEMRSQLAPKKPVILYDYSDIDSMFIDWLLTVENDLQNFTVFRSQMDHRNRKRLVASSWFYLTPYLTWSVQETPPTLPVEMKHRTVFFRGTVKNSDEALYRQFRLQAIREVEGLLNRNFLDIHADSLVSKETYLMELMHSTFAICPPGTSKITWRHLEACAYGIIPILFDFPSEQVTYYDEIFDVSNSISLPKDSERLVNFITGSRKKLQMLSSKAKSVFQTHNSPNAFAHLIRKCIDSYVC